MCRRSDGPRGPAGRRAQSEVIGVTLLTGVVVVVALVVGGVVVAESNHDAEGGPTTDLLLEASVENVTITHNGGDRLSVGNLRVVLLEEPAFTPAVANTTDGDGELAPGDAIHREHGVSPGDLTVLIVHGPSSTVLLDDRVTVPAAIAQGARKRTSPSSKPTGVRRTLAASVRASSNSGTRTVPRSSRPNPRR